MTNIPDEITNGKNIPVQAAIAANAPPSAKEPVSPINTDALYRLCKRNPTHAPAIDAPNIESSGLECKTIVSIEAVPEEARFTIILLYTAYYENQTSNKRKL
jgi:hypothetical protein